MAGTAASLFWIALCAVAAPVLAALIPRRLIPEVVLGSAVLKHGAFGELCPVIAMALLLSSRGTLASIGVLAIFTVVAVIFTLPSARLRPGSRTHQLIVGSSETTAQITVRLVVLLLISLGGLAIAFDLDVVLGAFAAGFVLRRALPEGDESLEHKIQGLAFGLLIPIFFITSGMAIDPAAIAADPLW